MSCASPQSASFFGPFLLPIVEALRLLGEDPEAIMRDVGIDPGRIADREWRLNEDRLQALMQACVDQTGDEAFGLQAAQQLRPQVLRSLGLAWLASDTVYDGLRRMLRFNQFMTTGHALRMEEQGDLVKVFLRQVHGDFTVVPAHTDFGLAMIVRMCRLTLGDFLAPVSVDMERPRPAEPERWEYQFAAPVHFEAHSNCICWLKTDIMEPLVTGDPMLARVNDEQTQAYIDSFLSYSVARDVVAKIVECLPDGPPEQSEIADALHMSNRTLQRKLKEEGTSFLDLLRDTRLQLAQRYLQSPGRSVVETAYMLGFSEPSTFSRAFKRWTGKSPAEYRATEAGGAPLSLGS